MQITKLKIQHNPFAKGFRDGHNRRDYRAMNKRYSDDENDSTLEQPKVEKSATTVPSANQLKPTNEMAHNPYYYNNTQYTRQPFLPQQIVYQENNYLQAQQQHQQPSTTNFASLGY